MVDVFDPRNLVAVQVEHIEFGQVIKASDLLDVVLSEHEHSERGHGLEVRDLFDLVVVKVQEYQVGQTHEVFYFGYLVVLQIQKSQALFPLQQRHVRQVSLVQVQPLGVGRALARLPINHKHAWNLRQLRKDDLIVVFYAAHDSIFEQVSVSLIFLARVRCVVHVIIPAAYTAQG